MNLNLAEGLALGGVVVLWYAFIVGALGLQKIRLAGVLGLLVFLPSDWIVLRGAIQTHFQGWKYQPIWPSGAAFVVVSAWLFFFGMTLLFAGMLAKPQRGT